MNVRKTDVYRVKFIKEFNIDDGTLEAWGVTLSQLKKFVDGDDSLDPEVGDIIEDMFETVECDEEWEDDNYHDDTYWNIEELEEEV